MPRLLRIRTNRRQQSNICLSGLASGHLKSLTLSGGNKRFPICPEWQLEQASPCTGLERNPLESTSSIGLR
ncbi:hypothetical protein TNIN_155091 [Trichonephila inaurata madagascariensis]|uniref:Uncharacterized protein n=1 Tax=Trichonephila inaurata madagascariensis TaxID=2747483 RepID=A0A8X7CF09_9ARAC|nr:hypothetical protein TNIN_155091 [Trichonephila inaurata madagascariensis]